MSIGAKIQQLRKQRGLSQEQLADKLGVSRQSISKWESEQSAPEINKIVQLSDLFGVTTDYLLKDTEEQQGNASLPHRDRRQGSSGKRGRVITGIVFVSFGAGSIFVMWVLSKIFPAPIVARDIATGLWLVGFRNFLWVHGLEGFNRICILIAVTGVILLLLDRIKLSWAKIRGRA
jgi:transcriptional regulator with XRE-family HTH domain